MELFTLFLVYFQRPQCHLREMPELSSSAPMRKSCHVAMSSILNKKASAMLFDESLIIQMERDDYKFFDFLGKEQIFDVIQGRDKNHCTVILTDRMGNRFFSFQFEESVDANYLYGRYIKKIDEITHKNLAE